MATEFAALLIPAAGQWKTPLAIMVSSVFAALQLRSIALSAKIQQIAAAALALIIVCFTLALVFAESAVSSGTALVPHAANGLGAWSLVVASIIYTYDGWYYAAYFSGEIKGGSGAVARACIKGTVVVIVLYVFLVAAIIMLLAYQNLLYLATPRILQALAVDGLFVRRAGEISKGGNPILAVLLSWGFSVGLIMIGGFEFLLHMSVFLFLFLYVLLIVGVIILRSRQPDTDRPYRAWGHPWSTYTCLFGWILIALFQVGVERDTAAYAAVMVAISWPVYRAIVRSRSNYKIKP